MNMKWKSELGTSSENSHYVIEHTNKFCASFLPDSGSGPANNISFMQPSVSCDWIHENPKMSVRRCPQEVVSGGLLQSAQTQELYIADRYNTSDGSVQSPIYENCPVQLQRQTHEASSYCIGHSFYSSPSIQSCSSGGSPASQTYPSDVHYTHSPGEQYGSSGSGYSSNQPETGLKYMLQELETALLGPDSDNPDNFEFTYEENMSSEFSEWNLDSMHDTNDNSYCQSSLSVYSKAEQLELSLATQDGVKEEIENEMDHAMSCNTSNVSKEQKQEAEDDIPHGDIRKLLVVCAKAIDNNDLINIDKWVAELRQLVSVSGHPMQRLGAYMVEGLVARMASSGATIYKALRCKEPASAELLSYMQILYEVCPYFKFGYMAANGAIAEAFKDEDRVHIVDFQIAQGSQWVTLLQALAARPKGPPHVHITGVDDPMSEYARGGGLELVGKRLSKLAETFKVPFEFHPVPVMGADVQVHMLEVRPMDALAVNFAFQLHHLPDESVNTSNHRDRIIRMVKGLRPKVVTLVEQESNTNTAPFFPRFMETLNYYTAIYESLDVTLPRESKERINVEQHCLARDIVNIIACEGAERVERHELMGKWRCRFSMAGFKPYPLSSIVNSTIKLLLEDYCENYSLFEKDNTLYLGWSDRTLIAATAWQ